MIKECINCKKEYETLSSKSKYCSRECNLEYNKIVKNCFLCGKEFKTSKWKPAKFCSNSCSAKFQMSDKKMVENIQKKRMKTIDENGGFKHTDEWKINMSKKMKGRKITWGDKISKSLIGKPHPYNRPNFKHSEETKKLIRQKSLKQMSNPDMVDLISKRTSEAQIGRKLSDETKTKIRIKRIKRISENKFNGNQVIPSWNPKACDYFEEFDKNNNTQGHHARNGGEYYIKKLGYWVDYINHDLKLIMEYDESHHKSPKQKEKDILRQEKIQEYFSDYEFKRIKE